MDDHNDSHSIDDLTAEDRSRVRRWEAAGRPSVPIAWDDHGNLDAFTDNLTSLLRGKDPCWASLRKAAQDWVDSNCPEGKARTPTVAAPIPQPAAFSDYVAALRSDQAMQLVNHLTVGLGTLSQIVRPQPDNTPAMRVTAALGTVYATLREAQQLLDGSVPGMTDQPFLS